MASSPRAAIPGDKDFLCVSPSLLSFRAGFGVPEGWAWPGAWLWGCGGDIWTWWGVTA